ncbi:MAG: hypothetical protein E7Z74_06575 [Methanobrevibacter millerae]|uniref:Uncharacterized protein n=1 Tax=Methanobrevibacter millerae TaxID=230361 RepID=A0A8T3VHD8_9EURY|nr:hypothetical protein [Methanobrevibacter millerae]
MGLKDIILVLILIFIFGIVIFGSLGSFLSNVNTAVTDVADAVAEDESFSVDFLQKNSQSMLYKEHSDNDGLGGSSSGKQSSSGSSSGASSSGKQSSGGISSFVGSSQNSFSNNDAGNKDASNNDKSDNESSFWNIIDILGPKSESSKTEYDDYQIDKETGMFDSEGNPIFLSIVSTSGGQMEPGIYEVYWSELHVFNYTKIK